MSVFLSEPGQIVFYSFVVVYFAVLGTIVSRNRKLSPPLKTKSRSRLNNPGIWGLNVPLGIGLTLLLGYAQIGPLPDWSYYLGLALATLGGAFTSWAYLILGRYFSAEMVAYQGHKLVQRGPYRLVRHPGYSGIFLTVVGGGFAVQSWLAVVLLIIFYAALFYYRMTAEEKILVAELGEQYELYSRRVKRLIPFIV